MSRIAELEERVRSASEAVARAEQAASRYPQYPSAFASLRSAEKFRDRASELLKQELLSENINACSYRIEYLGSSPAIRGVAAAVGIFQEMLTTVYHAITHGPRKRAKVSQDSVDATRLDFAFTFPGSVGFMMTIPNREDLFGESDLSKAMKVTLGLISANSTEEIDRMTEVVGLPAIRLAHTWASENSKFGFGADIKWRAEQDDPLQVSVEKANVVRLAGMLGQYIAKEKLVVIATLQQVDMSEKSFRMSVDERQITGTFEKAISAQNPAVLPKQYIAHLTVATRVSSAAQDGSETYFLDKLEEMTLEAVAQLTLQSP